MTEQTSEPTPAVDPSASVAADTTGAPTSEVVAPVDPSATVSADAGTPGSATEPAATPAVTPEAPAQAITPEEAAAVGVSTPNMETEPATAPGVDPQETAQVVLDEPGHDGAFIYANHVIGLDPVDVFAGDVQAILVAAKMSGRKVKIVESVEIENAPADEEAAE